LIRTRVLPATVLASLVLLSATTFSQIGYWHDSVTLMRHSMECTPDNSVAHEYLAAAYVSAGDANKAAQELEQAIRLEPGSANLHLQLGGALQELGRLNEAAAHYRQALAVDPRSADAYTNLGLIFVKQHQYADAKRQYLQALEIDPDFAPAHMNLAALCLTTEDFAGTIAHCERVLQAEPDLAPAEMCLAMALRGQGHLDDAIRHFKRVLQLTPNDPKAREELARTLALQRSVGSAKNQTESIAKAGSQAGKRSLSPARVDGPTRYLIECSLTNEFRGVVLAPALANHRSPAIPTRTLAPGSTGAIGWARSRFDSPMRKSASMNGSAATSFHRK
jgi:tetratricopeptide (TPR) repeat protein